MEHTHKALVQDKSGNILVHDVPTLELQDNQLRVSIISLGICGTDLQILRKARGDTASILGHEGIGIITEVGKNITGFIPDQLVVFNPVNPHKQEEILGHSFDGIFQENYIVDNDQIAWGLIQPLKNTISSEIAPLIEPLGTVIYGQSLVNQVCHQDTIVVVGAGAIGLAHVLYSKHRGVKKTILVNRSKEKLDWVIKQRILQPEDCLLDNSHLVDNILKKTDGKGVDAVYLCTPRESAKMVLSKALQYIKEKGCIDLVGGFKDGDEVSELPSIDLNSIRRANICGNPTPGFVKKILLKSGKTVFITGHRGTSKSILDEAIKVLSDNPKHFNKLITQVFTLNEAVTFLNKYLSNSLSKDEKSNYIKSVIIVRNEEKWKS